MPIFTAVERDARISSTSRGLRSIKVPIFKEHFMNQISKGVNHTIIRSLILIALALIPLASPAEQSKHFKIGVSLPLTGEAATYGQDMKNSFVMANEELGAGRFELVFEDDKCSGKEAANIAQKFVNVDHVDYVMGYGCSGALLAAAPILEKAKIVTIDAGGSAPAISQAGDYIFRTITSDALTAKTLFPYVAARQKKAGILSVETDFSQGFLRAFQANNSGQIEIIAENYLPESSDFRALMLKFKGYQVDSILLNPQSEAGLVNLYRQYKESKLDVPVYAIFFPGTPTFLEKFGRGADGIVFVDTPTFDEVANASGKKFFANFKKRYGSPASVEMLIATSYLAFDILQQAVASGEDAKNFLYSHHFKSIVDDIGFDSNGDVEGISLVLRTIKDGKPVLLKDSSK